MAKSQRLGCQNFFYGMRPLKQQTIQLFPSKIKQMLQLQSFKFFMHMSITAIVQQYFFLIYIPIPMYIEFKKKIQLFTIAVYKQQDGADFSHRIDNSFQIYSRLVFSVLIPSKMASKVVGILTKELLRRPRTLCVKVQTEEYFFNTDEYVTTFICNIF